MTKKIDLTKLNARQTRAVQYGFKNGPARNTKPLLVIAGAGTGKTNILAHRVAYMIELELIAPQRLPRYPNSAFAKRGADGAVSRFVPPSARNAFDCRK
jgi:hypothetical protein